MGETRKKGQYREERKRRKKGMRQKRKWKVKPMTKHQDTTKFKAQAERKQTCKQIPKQLGKDEEDTNQIGS